MYKDDLEIVKGMVDAAKAEIKAEIDARFKKLEAKLEAKLEKPKTAGTAKTSGKG